MSAVAIATLIKPIAAAMFMAFVGCIVFVLNKGVPDGELKAFLFRVRGEEGSETPEHECFKVKLIVFLLIVGLYGFIGWLSI